MVFSSLPFLFFFLPLFLILYFIAPAKLKNIILLLFSLIFYAWGEPVYIGLMILVTFSDYLVGRGMEKAGKDRKKLRTLLLVWSVVFDLLILGFFKYADFVINTINSVCKTSIEPLQLALPVGISFFTFQTLSYVIDLYKGEIAAEHSYFTYLTYVSMFPQLVAGPIVRYQTVSQELHDRKISFADISEGTHRFLRGLFKKILIANQVGALWENVRVSVSTAPSVAMAWLGALAFTLQIYYDFSGYSDMAIGLGRIMGFHFNENFEHPLSATSITDFWRRWHISLSSWFRNYVYIPLGGNRVSKIKFIRNIMIVWMLTGLWHGASWNFIMWGLYYGILLLLEKMIYGRLLEKCHGIIKHLYSLIIISTGFVIFALDDIKELLFYLGSMIGLNGSVIWSTDITWYIENYFVVLIMALVLSWPVSKAFSGWIDRNKGQNAISGVISNVIRPLCYMGLLIIVIASLVNDSYNPFLYFRF